MLGAYGIKHIVVCPGSRNAPLLHNLHQAAEELEFSLHPVTDERSAGFVAIGIAAHTQECVAICVTSGSAVLCCKPAIAEAYYRQLPILVLSADRPKEWINHLDGQTIFQEQALLPYAMCYDIEDSETCINETTLQLHQALNTLIQNRLPVQINVQIQEPLFKFNVCKLPEISPIIKVQQEANKSYLPKEITSLLQEAKRPMLIMGHSDEFIPEVFPKIAQHIACLPEIISNAPDSIYSTQVEKILRVYKHWDYQPDVVVHLGGAFVHKELKLFLRTLKDVKVIRIDSHFHNADTFRHLTHSVKLSTKEALWALANLPFNKTAHEEMIFSINNAIPKNNHLKNFEQLVIESLGNILNTGLYHIGALHLANSLSVRLASQFIQGGKFPIYCNRGTNGIEGSLSAAVGTALCSPNIVLAVIGDLSFFYDVNALWNESLRGNLRILLLNNQGGRIFSSLKGLNESPALPQYVSAQHQATAYGVSLSFNCHHKAVNDINEIEAALQWLFNTDFNRPAILEIQSRID